MTAGWAESALQWWQEAGVDTIVDERPRDWLKPGRPQPAAPGPVPAAPELPDALDAFQAWLATSPDIPFAGPAVRRDLPTGDPHAGLMVIVDMPSLEGGLLGGQAGALFDRMLGAIGRSREIIYLASLSPIRTPSGKIDEASLARLGEIARHHIGLVAPKAALLFGDACGKALLGTPVAGGRAKWHEITTKSGPVKALVTIRPEKLDEMPRLKKLAWADLQLLADALQ
jgi:DNA polymerase